jgi:hypothetical protein
VKDNQIKDLESRVWDNQLSNISGRLSGLIASTTEYLPLPAGWHNYVKMVSQYETGRGMFISTGLSFFLFIWVLFYELARFLGKKLMIWLLLKDKNIRKQKVKK